MPDPKAPKPERPIPPPEKREWKRGFDYDLPAVPKNQPKDPPEKPPQDKPKSE